MFHVRIAVIGVNSTAFGRKLTLFLASSRFPAFHLKCPAFFGVFRVEKNALYALFSTSSGTQTTRHSLFKLVKGCVFCLFVKLRLSPHCVGPGIKISRVIVARAKSMYRTDL